MFCSKSAANVKPRWQIERVNLWFAGHSRAMLLVVIYGDFPCSVGKTSHLSATFAETQLLPQTDGYKRFKTSRRSSFSTSGRLMMLSQGFLHELENPRKTSIFSTSVSWSITFWRFRRMGDVGRGNAPLPASVSGESGEFCT